MTDNEMKKAIIETLKNANKPLPLAEIADKIGITKDFWLLEGVLSQLLISGVVRVQSNGFGKRLYFV